MENKIEIVSPDKARKRNRQKSTRQKEDTTQKLYGPNRPPKKPTCGHNRKAFKCALLSSNDVLSFQRSFYNTNNKIDQDNFLLKYVISSSVKRNRPKTGQRNKKTMSLKFFVRKRKTGELVPVCKKAFLGILNLKKGRLHGVTKRHFTSGHMAKENRGGNQKYFAFKSKREAVEKFIMSLEPIESHYCRGKHRKRLYLHPELNITKLCTMYNDQALPDLGVKTGLFRNVFTIRFNIGFGSPKQDVCSTCLQLCERIKTETSQFEKQKLMTDYRIHKLRAKAFYKLLKGDEPHILLLSFDCQKNLPLPKIPDQSVYYSRQLYFYNFTIVVGPSHGNLNKDNVYAYTWTEEVSHKGSNEICSAVYHCLNQLNLNNIEIIRLMADGCGGQNKNSILIGAAMKWMQSAPHSIQKLELIFPVTGHSFLPSDRVFALTEKKIKKKESIIQAEEYIDIVSEHATVFKMGIDVPIVDWKTACKNVLKNTQAFHFQLKKCKRFIITRRRGRVVVRGEISYHCNTGVDKSIVKSGKHIYNIDPEPMPLGVPVKEAKLSDVKKLLCTHFGEEWQNLTALKYYKTVLSSENVVGRPNEDTEEEIEDNMEEVIYFV